ncbi:MAG: BON domain-containing protein [Deltaproteobacteria bacterium]|nr:BON domain-containing protein [Deltaproteobacteria bacterium]
MTKTLDTSERDARLGAYTIGGPTAVGAGVIADYIDNYLDGDSSSSKDLGPAPIGSDPWLRSEISSAISREKGLDGSQLAVRVDSAVVTIRGSLDDSRRMKLQRAVESVQGIKKLVIDTDG